MKKEFRKIFFLAMKQYIYGAKRYEDEVTNKEYNEVLQRYIIKYYEAKIKEVDGKLSKCLIITF